MAGHKKWEVTDVRPEDLQLYLNKRQQQQGFELYAVHFVNETRLIVISYHL